MINNEFPGSHDADTYTEVTHVGWFKRLLNSIGSAIFGIALFVGSFVVLYMNEGSVDESAIAQKAVAINAAAPDSATVGKFVAATGSFVTTDTLGDDHLVAARYVALTRTAEMFAWVESRDTRTEKHAGGSETKVTTYSYSTKWTASPENSGGFKRSGHNNPQMVAAGAKLKATDVKVGKLSIDMAQISLPSGKRVKLSDSAVRGGVINDNYLYLGTARPGSPKVGDERLSYQALPAGGTYTVLGQYTTPTQIGPEQVKDRTFYRAFTGTKADALKTLHQEFEMWIWGFRLVGFLMCWFGMVLFMEPLNTVLDVLPFFGSLGRGLSGFVAFPIAVVLSVVTMIVGAIAHNLIAMIVVGVLTMLACIAFFGRKRVNRKLANA